MPEDNFDGRPPSPDHTQSETLKEKGPAQLLADQIQLLKDEYAKFGVTNIHIERKLDKISKTFWVPFGGIKQEGAEFYDVIDLENDHRDSFPHNMRAVSAEELKELTNSEDFRPNLEARFAVRKFAPNKKTGKEAEEIITVDFWEKMDARKALQFADGAEVGLGAEARRGRILPNRLTINTQGRNESDLTRRIAAAFEMVKPTINAQAPHTNPGK